MFCPVCQTVNRKTMMLGNFIEGKGITEYTCMACGNTEEVKEDIKQGEVLAYVLSLVLPEEFINLLYEYSEGSSINEEIKWIGFEGKPEEFIQYFAGMVNHPDNAERNNFINMLYYGDLEEGGTHRAIAITGNGKASEANSKVILLGLLLVKAVMNAVASKEYIKATLEDALGLVLGEESIGEKHDKKTQE